ncbi:MAG: amidophosphoribosyltransferase [SAR324 cluster bacterium]|nr:amidophosphoribosyltransferase [SAR324 cluster bacterium]
MSSESLREECGIAAVYQLDQLSAPPVNVTRYIPGFLLDLQNRGQLSAGVTSYNPRTERLLQTHKDVGNVEQVFRMYSGHKHRTLIERYSGTVAVGHVRYATSGQEDRNFAQPFERIHGRKWKWFSIAFNGNLANFDALKQELIEKGYHITYNTDTEVMMHYFNRELKGDGSRSYKDIFSELAKVFDGAFTIAFLNACGDMVVMRDPLGIKPICYGIKDNVLVVASESVVLTRIGIMDYQDLEPGSILVATPNEGYRVERYCEPRKTAHCQFEWVYFANLASRLDRQSVFKARRTMGELLADSEEEENTDALCVPVPETAKIAGEAFGYKLGIPVIEGIVRNRYVGRTFIEGENRQAVILRKFTPLRELMENKKVFLVDDSLVRAATLKTIVEDLRIRGGAAEIHVRIACPAIIAPCFYGINIPTVRELFATRFWRPGQSLDFSSEILAAMAEEIGADSLKYLSIDKLTKAIGFAEDELCTACINTCYPTPTGTDRYQNQINQLN